MERHHPAGMADGPGAGAAAGGNRRMQGVLQGAVFLRRIDAGYLCGVMTHGAGGTRRVIPRQDRSLG
jgi:hypothetical protein